MHQDSLEDVLKDNELWSNTLDGTIVPDLNIVYYVFEMEARPLSNFEPVTAFVVSRSSVV